jgi:4-hydroxyproline epimerase
MSHSKNVPEFVRVVDSHTGGEPTRVIVENGPDLGAGSMVERRERFRQSFDHFRKAIILEPRGSDVMVGALPVDATDPSCSLGVIYFNNEGFLGMCGHGTIGLMVTLVYLGRIKLGEHFLDTPVGKVKTIVHDANHVTVRNVPCFRYRENLRVAVDGFGEVVGDIAWGGNWFYLVKEHRERVSFDNLQRLQAFTDQVQRALDREVVTGKDGHRVDHIELFGPPADAGADSRNYVMCPGGAYDRSPCGTGTSAKLACLAADGKLAPGQIWRQASIIDSVFEASYEQQGDQIVPSIKGSAYICGETLLRFDPNDPFKTGISQ